jgi:hypothetical protein
MFKLDSLMQTMSDKWGMLYYERDDRESALQNAWRMMRVKWIDPAIWRVQRRFFYDLLDWLAAGPDVRENNPEEDTE